METLQLNEDSPSDPSSERAGQPSARRRGRGLVLVGATLLVLVPPLVGWIMLKNPSTPASRDLVGSAVSPAEEAPGEGSEIDSSEAALIPARPSPDSRVSYLSDGHEVPIANGGVVPLGPDHQIEVFVAPFPPTDFDVDVDLYLTTSSGVPVPDAEVRVSYDMVFMRHGPYEMVMEDIGGGHYVGSLDMVMFGSWELLTEFTVPDSDDVLELAVTMYVWPV